MPSTPDAPRGDTLRLDVSRYREYLKDMKLSEAQAADMLNALWSILSAFVDSAFGVDSVHLARPQVKDETALVTDTAAEHSDPAQQPGTHAAKDIES